MAAPQIPPRPSRSQIPAPSAGVEVPKIPARPVHRSRDRTQSPNPESFPRSPLNEIPGGSNSIYGHSIKNASGSSLSLPQRPPSVSLPSIGQEGNEYGDLENQAAEGAGNTENAENAAQTEPEQQRKIGDDLPLHQPRPSFSSSNAKARVQAVTRTDSTQAAAAGIGKASTPSAVDDKDPQSRPLNAKVSFSRAESSGSTERPVTGHYDDDGIPEVVGGGQRVPMYPNAGDVQAPTPSPYTATFPPGIGFHNDGSRARQTSRNRSRQENRPPGSYGLHGHGMTSTDSLEKAWYDKHPEKLGTEEGGQYGPGLGGPRGEWALSSDDLNKIVRSTKSRASGFGTANIEGMPNEQIGYMATEEYTSRLASPQQGSYHHKLHSNHSQPNMESPLRKTSFPADQSVNPSAQKTKAAPSEASEHAVESETEDERIHVSPPTERRSKITGNGYDPPTEDLGPQGGNTEAGGGYIQETGYGVPILASDEVAKEPGSEYMQPAISPAQSRRGSQYYAGVDSELPPTYQSGFRSNSRSGSAANSRPTSRPGSMHGVPIGLHRIMSHEDHEGLHTPLEDVDEYEPLFPDEDGQPISASERFKRKEMMKRFPSRDIWEDTPNSLQLQATVDTPEPNNAQAAAPTESASSVFETPTQEAARKGEVSEAEKAKLMPRQDRLAQSHFKPHLQGEVQRPSMKQRFPSRDIWEDSPDSANLQAEIGRLPQGDVRSPPDEGLIAGAVVQTSGRPDSEHFMDKQKRENATAGMPSVSKPSIPPRPAKGKAVAQDSEAMSTPQPSIPARPQKRAHQVPPANIPPVASKAPTETSPTNANIASLLETHGALPLPDRSKPDIPKRPENPIAKDVTRKPADLPDATTTSSSDMTPAVSNDSVRSPPPAPKPKPAVPARPQGSKIAALKAGFLSDLDKRLQLGLQAPQKAPEPTEEEEKEPEKEKEPLSDARKGRARGPARRKPAASPAGTAAPEAKPERAEWGISKTRTLWEIGYTGVLKVGPLAAVPEEEPTKVKEDRDSMEATQLTAQNQKAEAFRKDVRTEDSSSTSDKTLKPEVTDPSSTSAQEAELDPPFQPTNNTGQTEAADVPSEPAAAEPKVSIQSRNVQSDTAADDTQMEEQNSIIKPEHPLAENAVEEDIPKGAETIATG